MSVSPDVSTPPSTVPVAGPAADRAPQLPADRVAEPAADRAYGALKARIIRGDLEGGRAISENVVCLELGMSRTPVHEAFLRLAAEELLTLEARKGAIVRPISPNEAEDVVEMREAVEAASAVRVAREGLSDASLAHLSELLDRQADCLRDGDVDGFVEADDAFHTAVVEAARNPIAAHFTRLIRDRTQRLRHQLMRIQPTFLPVWLDDHRELAEALERGDGAAYAAVLHRHVDVLRGLL